MGVGIESGFLDSTLGVVGGLVATSILCPLLTSQAEL